MSDEEHTSLSIAASDWATEFTKKFRIVPLEDEIPPGKTPTEYTYEVMFSWFVIAMSEI